MATAAALACLATPAAAQPFLGAPGTDLPGPAPAIDWSYAGRRGTSAGAYEAPASAFDLLGNQSFGAPPRPAGPSRSWDISPFIDVQGGVTDNARNSATDRVTSAFARLRPGITATADMEGLTGRLSYTPMGVLYAATPDQNRILQNYNALATVTLVPELFFLDLRGFGSATPIGGGVTAEANALANSRNVQQTASAQVSPYLRHRFGDLATVQLGYRFMVSSASGNQSFQPGQVLPFFTSTSLVANEYYASVRSGPEWGRLGFSALTNNSVYSGQGVYRDAHRYTSILQTRYALTREVAVLLAGGYQDLRYGGAPGYSFAGPVWNVGMRVAPEADSFLTLRYGRMDGFNSVTANGALGIGVRTRLFARYGERLGSAAQQPLDLLDQVTVDALGNLVDSATGAPALLAFGNTTASAAQTNLLRMRTGTLSVNQGWERDIITLAYTYRETTPVAIAPGTTAFAQTSNILSLAWSHMLEPTLTAVGYAYYGFINSSGSGGGNTYGGRTMLQKQFTETLSGTLQYIYTDQENSPIAGSGTRTWQNIILAGLRKTF